VNSKQAKRLRKKVRRVVLDSNGQPILSRDPDSLYKGTKRKMVKGHVLLDKDLEFKGRC
jgi:hypothetical protein